MVVVLLNKLLFCAAIIFKGREVICAIVQDFERFIRVRNSPVFIDKTELIKKLFQYDHLLLTAPHKFMKSTNIQMIKLFLGNNNRRASIERFFRNTNIWHDKQFVVQHLCNYPMIYCNFKPNRTITTFDDVKKGLKISVGDAFKEHRYLMKSSKISAKTKQQYLQYCNSELEDFEIGLKFLSEVLYTHHHKKIILLIDDFDYTVTYSLFKQELDSTSSAELVFRLMDNAINLNEFVEKSVVFGCLPFRLGEQFSGLYLLEHFKFMESKDFAPYFGFTQRDTKTLLQKFGLGSYMKTVSDWYGGYSFLYSDFYIYNPWSVLMFLKTRKLDIHWVTKESRQLLYQYIEPHYELQMDTSKLINRENVTVHMASSFTSYEIDRLKHAQFASYSYAEDKTEDHLFLQLLLECGYLTFAKTYRVLPISTLVKFPNMEIQKVFEQVSVRITALNSDINRY